MRDCTITTCTIGHTCNCTDLANALVAAPFHVIVMIVPHRMWEQHYCVAEWARLQDEPPAIVIHDVLAQMVLQHKAIYRLGRRRERRAFVALHKDKIEVGVYDERCLRSGGTHRHIHFGTLTLMLEPERHPEEAVKIGVIDVRATTDEMDAKAVASWLILDNVHVLAGFFGKPSEGACTHPWLAPRGLVHDIARLARATGSEP